MKLINIPSLNFDDRRDGKRPQYIVLHYTDMQDLKSALDILTIPQSQVSAHYLISKAGEIYHLVPDEKRAWHAGVGCWRGERDMNSASIGIELDHLGHSHGPEPYPQAQLDKLLELLRVLCRNYQIAPVNVIGHSDLAPQRKQDPGAHFPWTWLNQHGFGLNLAPTPQRPLAVSILEAQEQLSLIGYECSKTGYLDDLTEKVILAFQRRFTPEELTGTLTQNCLEAMSRVRV